MDDLDCIPDLVPTTSDVQDRQPVANVQSSLQQTTAPTIIPKALFLPQNDRKPIPLTILTGWLGSGKTSLLHTIVDCLSSKGETVAILQNETSSFMGVEKTLRLSSTEDQNDEVFGQVLEIANGCVCCSVRSDFLLAIDTLLNQRRFDYVILECSGMADVGNLITSLWSDKELECGAFLDGVICLLDAERVVEYAHWNDTSSSSSSSSTTTKTTTAEESSMINILKNQLVYSDTVIINKLDRCLFYPLQLPPAESSSSSSATAAPSSTSPPFSVNEQGTLQYLPQDMLAVVLTYLSSLSDRLNDKSLDYSFQSLLQDVKRLSPQLHLILAQAFRLNPTLIPLFSSHSRISVPSILNLGRFDPANAHISDFIEQKSADTHQHPHDNSLATATQQDRPKTAYNIKGVTVYTQNSHLIPPSFRPQHQDSCCSDHTHHNHQHEHQHQHPQHDDNNNDDPHGISTVVLTLSEGDLASRSTAHKAVWGMNYQRLTKDLDDFLFRQMQENTEEQWAAERQEWRKRFQDDGENPAAVAQDIIEKNAPESVVPEMEFFSQQQTVYRMKGVFAMYASAPKWYLQSVFQTFELSPVAEFEDIQEYEYEKHCKLLLADFQEAAQEYGDDDTALDPQDIFPSPEEFLSTSRQDHVGNPDVWQDGENRHCSLIVIGVNLNILQLVDMFLNCLETDGYSFQGNN